MATVVRRETLYSYSQSLETFPPMRVKPDVHYVLQLDTAPPPEDLKSLLRTSTSPLAFDKPANDNRAIYQELNDRMLLKEQRIMAAKNAVVHDGQPDELEESEQTIASQPSNNVQLDNKEVDFTLQQLTETVALLSEHMPGDMAAMHSFLNYAQERSMMLEVAAVGQPMSRFKPEAFKNLDQNLDRVMALAEAEKLKPATQDLFADNALGMTQPVPDPLQQPELNPPPVEPDLNTELQIIADQSAFSSTLMSDARKLAGMAAQNGGSQVPPDGDQPNAKEIIIKAKKEQEKIDAALISGFTDTHIESVNYRIVVGGQKIVRQIDAQNVRTDAAHMLEQNTSSGKLKNNTERAEQILKFEELTGDITEGVRTAQRYELDSLKSSKFVDSADLVTNAGIVRYSGQAKQNSSDMRDQNEIASENHGIVLDQLNKQNGAQYKPR